MGDAHDDRGLASKATELLKILGNGALERRLTVRAQKCSASAAEKIRAAGGSVEYLDERGQPVEAGASGEESGS